MILDYGETLFLSSTYCRTIHDPRFKRCVKGFLATANKISADANLGSDLLVLISIFRDSKLRILNNNFSEGLNL